MAGRHGHDGESAPGNGARRGKGAGSDSESEQPSSPEHGPVPDAARRGWRRGRRPDLGPADKNESLWGPASWASGDRAGAAAFNSPEPGVVESPEWDAILRLADAHDILSPAPGELDVSAVPVAPALPTMAERATRAGQRSEQVREDSSVAPKRPDETADLNGGRRGRPGLRRILAVTLSAVVLATLAVGGMTYLGVSPTHGRAGTSNSVNSCDVATVTDGAATVTVARGGLTSTSNYRVSGPLHGYALAFDGSTSWLGTVGSAIRAPQVYTELAWFRTFNAGIQPILGSADNQQPTRAGAADRALWLDGGHVITGAFRESDDATEVLTSSASYNDGEWHLAAVTLSRKGFLLYVDGRQVARRPVTSAQDYSGWWTVGTANLGGWPHGLPSHGVAYWSGSLAGVAVLPVALEAPQIDELDRAGSLTSYSIRVTAAQSPIHYWNLQDTSPNREAVPVTDRAGNCPGR